MPAALFSTDELTKAQEKLGELTSSPVVGPAVRLHNALQAFIRDIGQRISATPVRTVRCVDVSEIVAWIAPTRATLNAFSFNNLLLDKRAGRSGQAGDVDELLDNLDRLALRRLIFDNPARIAITESHGAEYRDVREYLKGKLTEREKDLMNHSASLLESISAEQFGRIRGYLESALERADRKKSVRFHEEVQQFRDDFIPELSDSLIVNYRKEVATLERLGDFERMARTGRVVQLGYATNASLIAALEDWGAPIERPKLKAFLEDQTTRDIFGSVREAIASLAQKIPSVFQTGEARRSNILTDANALAIIHTFNEFLHREGRKTQFEMVSRSSTIHSVFAALPPGRLRVTVRHPIFLPEIYEFSERALTELGGLAVSVEGLVRPWIDATTDASDASKVSEVLPRIRELGQDISRLMANAATVQVAISDSGQKSLRDKIKGNPEVSIEDLLELLELLARAMDERKSPFSAQLLEKLNSRMVLLVQSELRRLDERKSRTAVVNFMEGEPGTPFPHDCTRVRFTDARMSRTFLLYGERRTAERLLDCSIPILTSASNATSVELRPAALVNAWLRGVREGQPDESPFLSRIQATLLCALALAAQGRFTSAAAVASPTLHAVTRRLHAFDLGQGSDLDIFEQASTDPRIALAYKELFLLRHYCERAGGLVDLRRPGTDPFDIDGVRSYARAQRDLDFAILMTEQAQRLAGTSGGEVPIDRSGKKYEWRFAPTGALSYEDFRFPLISFAAWLDQFVFLQIRGEDEGVDPRGSLRSRCDIWVAASWIKGIETLAYRLSQLERTAALSEQAPAEKRSSTYAKARFLAYHEARALAGLYMTFIVFLAFDISPDIQALWNPRVDLGPDRLLVFRNHNHWISRLRMLNETYEFRLRPLKMFDRFAEIIEGVNALRVKHRSFRSTRSEERNVLVKEFNALLDGFLASTKNPKDDARSEETADLADGIFMRTVLSALVDRIKWLRMQS